MEPVTRRQPPPRAVSTDRMPASPTLLSPDFQPSPRWMRSSAAVQPKLTFAAPPEPRRQSLPVRLPQSEGKAQTRTRSPSPRRGSTKPRNSSRGSPPPSSYEKRVSFDTFDNPDAVDFAFTLRAKHHYWESSPSSRTFLFGYDNKDYSEDALEWLFEELIEDGDEVVCLRVIDKDSRLNNSVNLENQEYRTEAHALMKMIQDKIDEDTSISVILEFAVGKVQSVIRRMVRRSVITSASKLTFKTSIYAPTCLVVGSRGRPKHGIKNLLPGSISRDCLQNSLVPVLVIPPSAKRRKKKLKRQAKSSRRSYMEIVERSDAAGSITLSNFERGRSRNPHPVISSNGTPKPDAPALHSDNTLSPLRDTAHITSIPEDVEAEAAHAGEKPLRPGTPPPHAGGEDDLTPTNTPMGPRSPDLPILRVNSEDID